MQSSAQPAVSSSRSAVRSALVAEVFRRGGQMRARGEVVGESMLPALWPGDVVEIESCTLEQVQPGDIVLAIRGDYLVLHRMAAAPTADGFLLRGDSVRLSDHPFSREAFLGRLVRRSGGGRFVSAAMGPGLGAVCSRAIGVVFCHCGIARRLALKLAAKVHAPRPSVYEQDFGGLTNAPGAPLVAEFQTNLQTMNTA
jgi:hypothetical protein